MLNWFAPGTLDVLMSAPHVVTAEVDRIGIRLSGPVLRRRVTREPTRRPAFPELSKCRRRDCRSCSWPIIR
jgi:allophanate hydrolase subunit 2